MSGVHWVTEPTSYLEPKLGKSGTAAQVPRTVIQCFQETVRKHGNEKALACKLVVNGKPSKEWKFWTFQQYWDDSMKFAKALAKMDVGIFKIVNVLGFNAPEWFIATNGSILAGCIGAGIYMTNAADACHYITSHSKAEVVVVEGNKQLLKYTSATKKSLPSVKAVVVWGEPVDQGIASKCPFPVYSWDDFLASGETVTDATVDSRGASIRPGNCASLIYTSGTTGPPKAVMISHDNITWTAQNIIDNYMYLNHEDRIVSYLPLSHIAAQIIDLFAMMMLGGCAYFAQPDALKGTLTVTLKEVKPTFFFGVPRVWEKIEEKMVQVGRGNSGVKLSLAKWAKSIGAEHCRMAQHGNGGGAPACYSCANMIVLSKIKEALGLDQAKACFTAAAPISPATLFYFASLDIPIYEVFGQSECTGPHTVCAPKAWKVGTCGRPLKGTDSMIDKNTGELCYRGRHIFMGYMYMQEKTAETIDNEGYLHSGDVASFDSDADPDCDGEGGFMRITGRIKELIITAGGENVPPVLIENDFKAAMVALSNCMVIGDARKFLTVLISLKVEVDGDAKPTDMLAADSLFVAKSIGSSSTTYSAAKADPLWAAYIESGRKTANSKTTSSAQMVQKFAWLPEDFSEKSGDLTPTLKLKRSVVANKYASLIESMYV
ncbi:long chain acyl-CoA synthetase [Ochromonadaceae sp. CCMP2298]|nr:long chain acyl-CoA synthetase [Ochromonadaceae sp. CCMP2298]|eukprot:CAMPEP_0173184346 /NCGR_PEP_ID=MMETSP1141-20130122/8916_1 /TAXON_ID=483371 /ORGANISM="non described non described, Strain CCMP2298" /LENGTH=659 /DNA_ID=CAMNT_0014107689 /DNA_START=65 /DNA_END=2044 /DNA_ORIENTATION=-